MSVVAKRVAAAVPGLSEVAYRPFQSRARLLLQLAQIGTICGSISSLTHTCPPKVGALLQPQKAQVFGHQLPVLAIQKLLSEP